MLGHGFRTYIATEKFHEPMLGQGKIGKCAVVDEVVLVVCVLFAIESAIGLACRFDLFGTACQAKKARMDIVRELAQNLRSIPVGVNGYKDRFYHLLLLFEDIDCGHIANRIERADIRTERVAKINECWLINNVLLGHGLTGFTYKREWPANLTGSASNSARAALRKLVTIVRRTG